MSHASSAIRSLPIHAIGGSSKPTRRSTPGTARGTSAPTVHIHARTIEFLSTERNASRRPFGDHTALKNPRYADAFELNVRNVRDFTSSNLISLVGTVWSSARPGR